jgi:hypothetical protein
MQRLVQGGEKRLPDQAADWISPVNAARTASSRSASVKPRCSRQLRNDPLNENAALLKRHAVGGCPEGP